MTCVHVYKPEYPQIHILDFGDFCPINKQEYIKVLRIFRISGRCIKCGDIRGSVSYPLQWNDKTAEDDIKKIREIPNTIDYTKGKNYFDE